MAWVYRRPPRPRQRRRVLTPTLFKRFINLSGTVTAVSDNTASLELTIKLAANVQAVASNTGTLTVVRGTRLTEDGRIVVNSVTEDGDIAIAADTVTEDGAFIFAVGAPAAPVTVDLTGTITSVGDHDFGSTQLHRPAATETAVADHDFASTQIHKPAGTVTAVSDHDFGSNQVHKLTATVTAVASNSANLKELERPSGTITSVADHDFASKQVHKPAAAVVAVGDHDAGSKQTHKPAGDIQAVASNTATISVGDHGDHIGRRHVQPRRNCHRCWGPRLFVSPNPQACRDCGGGRVELWWRSRRTRRT